MPMATPIRSAEEGRTGGFWIDEMGRRTQQNPVHARGHESEPEPGARPEDSRNNRHQRHLGEHHPHQLPAARADRPQHAEFKAPRMHRSNHHVGHAQRRHAQRSQADDGKPVDDPRDHAVQRAFEVHRREGLDSLGGEILAQGGQIHGFSVGHGFADVHHGHGRVAHFEIFPGVGDVPRTLETAFSPKAARRSK